MAFRRSFFPKPRKRQVVTARPEVGVAWYVKGHKVKRFLSGYITPQGWALLESVYRQRGRRVNFYILPNARKKTTPDQPPFLVFAPYSKWEKE